MIPSYGEIGRTFPIHRYQERRIHRSNRRDPWFLRTTRLSSTLEKRRFSFRALSLYSFDDVAEDLLKLISRCEPIGLDGEGSSNHQ